MTEDEERLWIEGNKAAYRSLMGECVRQLGEKNDLAALQLERAKAIAKLRELCSEHGDNDWPDDLHLADIIDKHLGRHLGG